MAQNENRVFHIGLIGLKVTSDWNLIQRLKSWNHVSLIKREYLFLNESGVESLDVLILDSTENGNADSEISLKKIIRKYPGLCIVLVNGGLTQEQIVSAFKEGAQDYFSDPYDVKLLVERVQFLATQNKKNRKLN